MSMLTGWQTKLWIAGVPDKSSHQTPDPRL
jgi:hypothetical protein